MPTEPRVRVSPLLPVYSAAEKDAANAVIVALTDQFGGCTVSSTEPPTFRGYWIDPDGLVIRDEVSLATVDVGDDQLGSSTLTRLEDLKRLVFRLYEDAGSPQQEVWLTTHQILRVVG
ncbi:MAG: hypothetical protein ACR2L3_03125 [Actinomycetota bacterium]